MTRNGWIIGWSRLFVLAASEVGSEANRRGRRADWSQTRRVCFGGMRSDGGKDGSDPILTHRHFAERLDGTGKM